MDLKRYELKCYGKEKDKYLLKLFREKESHYYDFDYDNNILSRYDGAIDISEDDVIRIREVINNFSKQLEYAYKNYTLAYFDKINMKVYYKMNDDNFNYDYVRIENDDILVGQTIFFYHIYPFYKREGYTEEAMNYYRDLNNNPIYLSAKEHNDRLIELRMKDKFSYISDDEVKEIESITKTKYIKRLNKAFNNDYVIFKLSDEEYKIIKNSCFILLHMPAFAMRGNTRDYYEFNPYTKYGVDAAKNDSKPFSFNELLDKFNKEDNKHKNTKHRKH